MIKLFATLLLVLAFISGDCFKVIAQTESGQASLNQTSVAGRVIGVIMIPAEEMKSIPEDVKSQKMGNEYFIDFSDGSREIRVGIEGWSVSAGRGSSARRTNTGKEGSFVLQGVSPGSTYLTVSFQGVTLLKQRVTVDPGKSVTRDLVVSVSMEDLKGMSRSIGINGKESKLPCLSYNFLCKFPVGSDCYKNIVRGNPFCWLELMNSPLARWCNGKKNCSVFILHRQKSHCDLTP